MVRVYYRYDELEEYQLGMWRVERGEARKRYISDAAGLMKSPDEFCRYMLRAIREWPRSCAHNLCVEQMNRIAWLGHAGCCIGVGSPEECTRAGWYHLNDEQMSVANSAAAYALSHWRPTGAQLELAL